MAIPDAALAIYTELGGSDGLLRRYLLAFIAREEMQEKDSRLDTTDVTAALQALWTEIEVVQNRAIEAGNNVEGQEDRNFTMNVNESLIQGQSSTVRTGKDVYAKLVRTPDSSNLAQYGHCFVYYGARRRRRT